MNNPDASRKNWHTHDASPSQKKMTQISQEPELMGKRSGRRQRASTHCSRAPQPARLTHPRHHWKSSCDLRNAGLALFAHWWGRSMGQGGQFAVTSAARSKITGLADRSAQRPIHVPARHRAPVPSIRRQPHGQDERQPHRPAERRTRLASWPLHPRHRSP